MQLSGPRHARYEGGNAVDVLNKITVENRKKAVKKVQAAIDAAKNDIITHIDQQADGLHQHLDAVQSSMIPRMWLIILGAALFIVVFWIAGHVSWNYDAKQLITVGNELTAEGAVKMVNGAPVPISGTPVTCGATLLRMALSLAVSCCW